MHLTIDELLDYTDEERAKWEAWFTDHGNDSLKFATPMDVHPTVGALIFHCFWAVPGCAGELHSDRELADEFFGFQLENRYGYCQNCPPADDGVRPRQER